VTITVDIRPEIQAELARQAAARGSAIEAYAATLLEGAVDLPAAAQVDPATGRPASGRSLVEVCAMVRGLTDRIPG
jgi:hypothetical protein